MSREHLTLFIWSALFCLTQTTAQTSQPEWCRKLPRPEYRKLEKVDQPDQWFEVYRIRGGVFAIYEPHQSEVRSGKVAPSPKNVKQEYMFEGFSFLLHP